MLYERWGQVVGNYSQELAVCDVVSGERLTFADLARRAESRPVPESKLVFPEGQGMEFILEVLAGWKAGRVVCPLEQGQSKPEISEIPRQCVHLKTTSASTGTARAIAFTEGQLCADLRNIVETMGLRRDWPNIGVISLAHSYGFSNLVLPLLLEGIPLIFVGSPLPEALRRAASGFESVTLAAVPAMWRTWDEVIAIPGNVRLAISAGAPLAVELEQSVFSRTGLKIHNFYGSSECGGIAFDVSEKPRTESACVGEAMKNVSLAAGADGCLEVRSAAVGETYLPESDERLRDGCFRTTDLARVEGKSVHLLGRATDVIHVAGRKVAPESIEQALQKHPAVRECVVFSVPAGSVERGESIVACVSLATDATEGTLRNHVSKLLPNWQVPRHWWLVPELSANERGKVSRAQWRERYLDQVDRSAKSGNES